MGVRSQLVIDQLHYRAVALRTGGFSDKDAARLLDISRSSLRRLLSGKRGLTDEDNAKFKINLSSLITNKSKDIYKMVSLQLDEGLPSRSPRSPRKSAHSRQGKDVKGGPGKNTTPRPSEARVHRRCPASSVAFRVGTGKLRK